MPFIATCVDAIGTVFWDRPYLRNEHFGMVLRCIPSEEAVGIGILKKKWEGKVGPVPMGQRFQTDFLME